MVARWYYNFLLPAGLLSGTIIGAGVFSLPYVFNRAGINPGFFYLFVLGLAMTVVHLLYARLVLKTRGHHNFVGYARLYLGRWAVWPALAIGVLQGLINLVVYLVLSLSFSNLLFAGGDWLKIGVFWLLGSSAVFLNFKKEAITEFFITVGIALIIFLIFWQGVSGFSPSFLTSADFSWGNIFLPIGPIIYSLGGRPAVLELVGYLKGRRQSVWPNVERAVTVGTLFPVLLYGAFVIGILSLAPRVTPDAVSGLTGGVAGWFLGAVGLLGLLNILSSYIAIGFDISHILRVDLNISRPVGVLMVVFCPILLFLIGFNDFLQLVSASGLIFGSLEIIFIIWMWRRLSTRS